MNTTGLPKPARYTLRVLTLLILPLGVFLGVLFLGSGLDAFGKETGTIYTSVGTYLVAAFVLMGLSIFTLSFMWLGALKLAKRTLLWGLGVSFAFLAISGAIETSEGKKILATADSFKPPAGLEREYEMNADEFVIAPALVPCWDLMGEGCPHINRAWSAEHLTRADMEKSLKDSSWDNVTIDEKNCNFVDTDFQPSPRCDASGIVDGYKADVNILELSDERWQIRIYLRSPDNLR